MIVLGGNGAGHSNGAGRIKQRVLTPLNHHLIGPR